MAFYNTRTVQDQNDDGVIGFEEEWRQMFDSFDFDHNGTIDATELDSVMAHYRLNVSTHILDQIVMKYAGKLAMVTFQLAPKWIWITLSVYVLAYDGCVNCTKSAVQEGNQVPLYPFLDDFRHFPRPRPPDVPPHFALAA
ncbi:hypothetical protein DFH94DRAFT_683713 [Russula ochroleuca]|uniref:EF-hand domain-containing protein n=1 Tax=Russula ochroleuca TaxID=152965 RepID=A0A9P5MRQ2_9AGAM|nr:hypothetical protein DFH94DRAFT_683713 [Russula ochroleuca]